MKTRAKMNRTICLSLDEEAQYGKRLIKLDRKTDLNSIINKTICQDTLNAIEYLPDGFVDLLFADPPYNMAKKFNKTAFSPLSSDKYAEYIDGFLSRMVRLLKPGATVYMCGDWKSSAALEKVLSQYFTVRNRITWQREKGRGSKSNWKNCSEDIWFATFGKNYTFNVDAVKINKKVIAPYKDSGGKPKDWAQNKEGKYRLTHPSNIWTDLTVPFWSMPENTPHPTQKPEKLLAKLILASSNAGDVVFDPFLGSGTTSVVAKKLGRKYLGIEIDEMYCRFVEKRLDTAEKNPAIQGYDGGNFLERNYKLN